MADLDNTTKLKLESILGMGGGYVLDLTNATFGDFVRTSIGVDPYERYGADLSKARLLRAVWENEPNEVVAKLNLDLLEHWRVSKQVSGETSEPEHESLRQELVARFQAASPNTSTLGSSTSAPVAFTTEASVSANKIAIEIHEDIYAHISQYLANGDYFHAVEESYKLVRGKLREITGNEKASDVFNNSAANERHYKELFGKEKAASAAEADFFRGIGYLHLGVQHLRNEKAHTLATPMDPNLAIHYVALASLAYDLITRYVSDDTITEIENLVLAKRRAYRSATAFYNDFEDGKWLESLSLPVNIESASVRKVLKRKWLQDADFTRSWDHSNLVLMQLELVAAELTADDIDELLGRPTVDSHGNDQMAGMLQFLEYVEGNHPETLSAGARQWMADHS